MASRPNVVTEQPRMGDQPGGSMKMNPMGNGSPPGLEKLVGIDQLVIKQKNEFIQAYTPIETKNNYVMKNVNGEQVFTAHENSEWYIRCCCGKFRSFKMHVLDNEGRGLIRAERHLQFCAGYCWFIKDDNCCASRITIEAPPGNPIGYVNQKFSLFRAQYSVLDGDEKEVMSIRGPLLVNPIFQRCFSDLKFQFFSSYGLKIGGVTRVWKGIFKELITLQPCRDADEYIIEFPRDLDVKQKALLIGALFLIEFVYFEG